jgi:hypothetical protein
MEEIQYTFLAGRAMGQLYQSEQTHYMGPARLAEEFMAEQEQALEGKQAIPQTIQVLRSGAGVRLQAQAQEARQTAEPVAKLVDMLEGPRARMPMALTLEAQEAARLTLVPEELARPEALAQSLALHLIMGEVALAGHLEGLPQEHQQMEETVLADLF